MDVVLDCVGGSHSTGNLAVLTTDARWVLFGLLGGRNIDGEGLLGKFLAKRISIRATTLRKRSAEYKANLVHRFSEEALPFIGEYLANGFINTYIFMSCVACVLMFSVTTFNSLLIKIFQYS